MKTSTFTFFLYFMLPSIVFCQAPAIQWQKSLGGSNLEQANSVQTTLDGGYIVAGISSSNDGNVSGNHAPGYPDYWIVKLSAIGSLLWQKCLGGSGEDIANSIVETKDGGFIVAGYASSNDGNVSGNHVPGYSDYWIVKLDVSGVIQWQKCLGGSNEDRATAISQTIDGGYIVAGWSRSNDGDVSGNHGDADYWIVKLSSAGNIEWQKSSGGSSMEMANSIQQTQDGGYVIAGSSYSNDGDVTGNHGPNVSEDYWVVKLSSIGNIEWEKSLGGSGIDEAYSVSITTDGGYVIAGLSTSNDGDVINNHGFYDYWIVKLSNSGSLEWQKSLGGTLDDMAASIRTTSDHGYIVTGRSFSYDGDITNNLGGSDYWIVKLDNLGNLIWQKNLGGSSNDGASSIQPLVDGGYIVGGFAISNDGDVSGNHGSFDSWVVKLNPPNGIWIGSVNSNWENAANWSNGVLPDLNSNVVINFGTVSINSNVTIQSLKLNSGASLKVNSNYKLEILK